jgi:hypothetical protein
MPNYFEDDQNVEFLEKNIVVFHNTLEDPDAYIDYYEEYGSWRGWYGFGRQIDGRGQSFSAHPTLPTWEEWQDRIARHEEEDGEDKYREEVARVFNDATHFYTEKTGITLPNWSCQPWGLARYIPDENLIANDILTMDYHTDYQVEDSESAGDKFGITAVLYPNDDYEGGELVFKIQNKDGDDTKIEYKPKAGDLVMFPSGVPYFHAVKRIYGSPKYITRLYWMYNYEGSQDWHDLLAKYGDKFHELEQDRKRRPDIRIMEPYMRVRFTLKEYYDLYESGELLPDYRGY